MRLFWSVFIFSTLLQCSLALKPWYFTWTDASGETHSETSTTPDLCKKIDNPIGKHFDWTSSDGWCIYLWENTNCTGHNAGYTCKSWPWRKDAGHHIQSFKASINNSDIAVTSSTAVISSSTAVTSMTNTPSNTAITNAANTPSSTANANDLNIDNTAETNSNHSLSGGEIAGVVIGVVAGVAILAGVVWFFLFHLRRQKKASTLGSSTEPGLSEHDDGAIEDNAATQIQAPVFTTLSEMSDTQKEKPGELGDNHIVEMPDSHRTVELDATETVWHKK